MSKETNIFEVATRAKYRFPYKGQISTEDLWDLSLTALDSIFKVLNKQKKTTQEESLLEVKSAEDEALDNQIAIVKHIVSVKQQEAADRLDAKKKKETKQRLLQIKAAREDARLETLSDEDLDKMIAELE